MVGFSRQLSRDISAQIRSTSHDRLGPQMVGLGREFPLFQEGIQIKQCIFPYVYGSKLPVLGPQHRDYNAGSTISTLLHDKINPKIARYCPLVIQGFSNFLGLFQGIMANPVMDHI